MTRLILLCLLPWPVLAHVSSLAAQEKVDLAAFDASIKPTDREHWAYLPVKKPDLPKVKDAALEPIRDSVLHVSGKLNPKMYGPWMYPEVPKEALAGSSDPDKIWKPFDEDETSRRTIYAHIKRSFVVPLLEVLDYCDTARPTDRRLVTTVAPQALTLFNGSFVNRQAKHFAPPADAERDRRAVNISRTRSASMAARKQGC